MSTVTTTTTVFLPPEIIMEILSRLPASSLVNSFKLVCKSWRNSIKDPDFVKMHLLNRGGGGGSSITANSSLICKYGNYLFQLHPPFNFEGGGNGIPPPPPPPPPIAATAVATEIDFDSLSRNWRLVGSCNGLLCLSFNADENIILLNPSTRKYKTSPKQPIKYPKATIGWPIYGFGCCYNSTTNNNIYDDDDYEYKVVRIVYFYGIDQGEHSSRSQIDIYSMSSNSWRTTTDTKTTIAIDYAFNISSKQSGVFVNEALHWVAAPLCGNWDTIASFDIRDEEFRQVPIPLQPPCEPYDDEPYFNLAAVILINKKGCLSMIRFSHANNSSMDDDDSSDLEIWVMKEYGIKESWTKEFVISSRDTDPPRALSEFKISWRSNAYVLKGDQMLIEGLTNTKKGCRLSSEGYRKLVLYDINKRKIINGDFKMIGVPVEPNVPYPRIDLVDYIETLVSLKSSVMAGVLL